MSKKYKKHCYEDRLKYMKLLEAGYSVDHITSHYGISHHLVDVLWEKYRKDGPSGLTKKRYVRTDGVYREMILRDIENNCLTLSEAAIKYDVSVSCIQFWKRKVMASGYGALYETKRKCRPPKDKNMGRPKKKKLEEMTDLERLKYENERLRAENALLKKVRALVEEREARLREIGQKPSKD